MHKVRHLDHNWLAIKNNNDVLKKHLNIIRGVVYDLGCGVRPYQYDILKVADEYYGVDWSATFHILSADIVADLNNSLPINGCVADTVVSFQVLEHICEPQVMLNEAFRILKSDGNIFLTVPFQWWIHEEPYDFFRYTQYGLKYLFEKAGFVDVVVEPQSGFFTMWILKMNYFSLRFLRVPKPLYWLIKMCLVPFWFFGQTLAPLLDTFDGNWAYETSGFIVTAKKPTFS